MKKTVDHKKRKETDSGTLNHRLLKKSEDKSLLTMRLSEILPLSATIPAFPSVVEESVISPISVNLQVHNPLEIPLTRIMPSVRWMGQL